MNGTMELECNYNRGDLNALADAVMGGMMVLEYAPDRQYEVRYISDGLYDLLEMEPGNMGASEMEPIDWEDCIHPEDFEKLRESLDNAVHNLCDFNVEFRVRSKEKGYKWLSANVVVRKCEEEYSYYIHCMDISERMQYRQAVAALGIWQAALEDTKRRYEDLLGKKMNLGRHTICCYHLNLTKNSCERVDGRSTWELHQLESETAQGLFENMYPYVQTEMREEFCEKFSRKALLETYSAGIKNVSFEHIFRISLHRNEWVETRVSMAKNPQTSDIEAVVCVMDIQNEKLQRMAMRTIINRRYAFMMILNAVDGNYTIYFKGNKEGRPNIQGRHYSRDSYRYIRHFISERKVEQLRKEISIEHILGCLTEPSSEYSLIVNTREEDGPYATLQLNFSYMDFENKIILFTGTDITEVVRKDQEQNVALKNALAQAQKATEEKSSFMSRLNHDMRTPLNGILGMAELMIEKQEMPDAVRQNIIDIHNSGKFLLSLINTSLDMYKIENNKMVLNMQVCDYNVVIRNILATIHPMAISKNIHVALRYVNTPVRAVVMDELRIQQIFMNLLSNAIKFTQEGGKVELIIQCLSYENGVAHTKITVKDNGVGMSEEFMPKLFAPFEQELNMYSKKNVGTGLGMPIVKQLVEAMGGRIEAQSEQGVGTAIDVYLDFEYVPEQQVQQQVIEENDSILEHKRVLLCEDYPLNLKVAACMLKEKGMQVECAENGVCAVKKFESSPCGYYNMILMDVRMPVMDGLQAADAIRSMDRTDAEAVPIIAMTANTHSQDIRKCKEVGMNDYIAKPLDMKKLYQVLVKNLQQQLCQNVN